MDDANENLHEKLGLDSHKKIVEIEVFKFETFQCEIVLNLQKRHEFIWLEIINEVELEVARVAFQMVKH